MDGLCKFRYTNNLLFVVGSLNASTLKDVFEVDLSSGNFNVLDSSNSLVNLKLPFEFDWQAYPSTINNSK
mgnify:CR=1 FL=1